MSQKVTHLADALVGIIHILPEHFEPVIGLGRQPLLHIPSCQPAAPVHNEGLLQIIGIDSKDDIAKSKDGKPPELVKNLIHSVILERRIKRIVPFIQ